MPPTGLATSFCMSENSQAIAFTHSTGSVHLFAKGNENNLGGVLFNDFADETLFVEAPQASGMYIDVNNEIAPLSSVPVPLMEKGEYTSDWVRV